MNGRDEVFLKKLLATFKVEAEEHLRLISDGLIELEKTADVQRQVEIIESVFRESHSMKGAARAVNISGIESVCKSLENIFGELRHKEKELSPELFDGLHKTVDSLRDLVRKAGMEQAAQEAPPMKGHAPESEKAIASGACEIEIPDAYAERALPADHRPQVHTAEETTRISKAKLDSLLLQTEQLLSARQAVGRNVAGLTEISGAIDYMVKKWTEMGHSLRQVEAAFRDKASDYPTKEGGMRKFFEFLESHAELMRSVHAKILALKKTVVRDQRSISAMTDAIIEEVRNVSMLPFSHLLDILPKVVRDISHCQGKQAELVVHGGDLEIDRRILDEMKAPIIHMVRNCIDHGIEKPDERLRMNKSAAGAITVAVSYLEGKKAEITVADDGSGVDLIKVRAAIVKAGLVSEEKAKGLDETEMLRLIFVSGVTTSPIITDLSGRGLGLAIVMEKAEKLGGSVSCESSPGRGTTLRVVLPLTLVTFRGVPVRLEDQVFVFPASSIERTVRVRSDEIKTIENRETLLLNDQAVALVHLSDALELGRKERKEGEGEPIRAVIAGAEENRMAFRVDEVLHEQEVLVKGLGKQLAHVRNIAGAALLSAGRLAPVLNVPELMRSAVQAHARPKAVIREGTQKRKSLLVVEDSVTSRTLLRNILEAAGYEVKTAVDGMDAFSTMKTEDFDLVVSDVDMPKMNGFDLTAKIRSDKKLSELPVVLVTALESREDRERGVDAGANAYIVKSSFDQSNLLEVIERLI